MSCRDSADQTEPLTTRETEVTGLVAEGMTNREVARSLGVSVRTVESHVDSVLGKLGLHNRTQLATWVSRGWVRQGDYAVVNRLHLLEARPVVGLPLPMRLARSANR